MKIPFKIIIFLIIFFSSNHLKADPGYFCIWTGTGDYTDKKWFTHSSDHKNYKKFYGGANDCRERALYVVTQTQNKKLYKKLLWKFKNIQTTHPAKKLDKKLFALVSQETPKNIVKSKEAISQTTKPKKIIKVKKKLSKEKQIEIDQIKEMFDIGALTKDEYDKAIQRVLN